MSRPISSYPVSQFTIAQRHLDCHDFGPLEPKPDLFEYRDLGKPVKPDPMVVELCAEFFPASEKNPG